MVIKKVIHKLHDGIQRRDWRYMKARIQAASEVRSLSKHLKHNFWTLAISTFGIATGLVWFDVVKAIVDEFFPNRNSLLVKFYVAGLITVFSIVATYFITRVKDRNGS